MGYAEQEAETPRLVQKIEELEKNNKFLLDELEKRMQDTKRRIDAEKKLEIAVEALEKIEDLPPLNERERRVISREALAKIKE